MLVYLMDYVVARFSGALSAQALSAQVPGHPNWPVHARSLGTHTTTFMSQSPGLANEDQHAPTRGDG